MKFKRMLVSFIFFVLMMVPALSIVAPFVPIPGPGEIVIPAPVPIPYTAQQVLVPYASINSSAGYWTGLSIYNSTDSSMYYSVRVVDADGDTISTAPCVEVEAGGNYTNLLENFFSVSVSGRMSIIVETNGASTTPFHVTIFMGNNGTSNPGFAFQNYTSSDFTKSLSYACPL